MPVTINATPGDSAANSYETLAEFKTYLGLRLHLSAEITALIAADPDDTLSKSLIAATRGLDQILTKFRRLEVLQSKRGIDKFYLTRPYWTGFVSTAFVGQARAWPRGGMFDRNGVAIVDTVVPQELKDAISEFAILAISSDLTADNAIVDQGIEMVKAGPVEVQFKEYIQKRILPDVVYQTLVSTWMTDELYENIPMAQFRTAGRIRGRC